MNGTVHRGPRRILRSSYRKRSLTEWLLAAQGISLNCELMMMSAYLIYAHHPRPIPFDLFFFGTKNHVLFHNQFQG